MDRNTILLILVCVGLMFASPVLVDIVVPPKKKPAAPITQGPSAAPTTQSPGVPAVPLIPAPQGTIAPSLKPIVATEALTYEDPEIVAKLSSVGGGIQELSLKKYLDHGKPVILNHRSPLPILSARVGDISYQTPFQTQLSGNHFQAVHQTPSGLQLTKQIVFLTNFQAEATFTLKNAGSAPWSGNLEVGVGGVLPLNAQDAGDYTALSYYSAGKTHHQTLPSLRKYIEKQGKSFEENVPLVWASLRNQYFAVIVTPSTPFGGIHGELFHVDHPEVATPKNPRPKADGILATFRSDGIQLAPGSSTNFTFHVFAGPKNYEILTSLTKSQDEVLDLGFFEIFSRALLWLMGIFHNIFGNWGVAIICVTILIKVVFWPLTAISTRSMKQMQALSPKMNEIKEKYKDNQKKMNEEMMNLYREYRINPLAGCLPMLIQFPIFIAFYYLLLGSVELRGAPFVLWIRDLSAPDTIAFLPGLNFPINPLPLIMAGTMIWQMKMTPQAPNADPAMKMMMWIMPAVFLFFCYNFSSGLSLYWTAQNLLSILQTYLTKDKPVELPQKTKHRGGFGFSRPIDKKK
jgi:YidC/Oxa1 family membrane protein insertase